MFRLIHFKCVFIELLLLRNKLVSKWWAKNGSWTMTFVNRVHLMTKYVKLYSLQDTILQWNKNWKVAINTSGSSPAREKCRSANKILRRVGETQYAIHIESRKRSGLSIIYWVYYKTIIIYNIGILLAERVLEIVSINLLPISLIVVTPTSRESSLFVSIIYGFTPHNC